MVIGLEKLGDTNRALENIGERLTSLEARLLSLQGEVGTLGQALPELSGPLPGLIDGVVSLQRTVEMLNDKVSELGGKLDPLSQARPGLQGEVGELNTNVSSLNGTLGEMGKSLAVLSSSLALINALLLNFLKPVLTLQKAALAPLNILNMVLSSTSRTLGAVMEKAVATGKTVEQFSQKIRKN